jgi:hypothetical protein
MTRKQRTPDLPCGKRVRPRWNGQTKSGSYYGQGTTMRDERILAEADNQSALQEAMEDFFDDYED